MPAVRCGGRRRAASAALLVLGLLGSALLAGCGPPGRADPPEPARGAIPAAPGAGTAQPPGPAQPTGPSGPVGRSAPEHVDIPRIAVSAPVGEVGLNTDGTVEVPPFVPDSPAAWYRYSPTPGELGPAVLLGHATVGRHGPSVFFRLGSLRPGDRIDVRRRDGRTARFTVERVSVFPKDGFPTDQVYGDTDHAALRLITCGGDRAPGQTHYPDNVVVFARLAGVSG